MPGDRRSQEEIRQEITSEREQLAAALAELRAVIHAKRRLAVAVGGLMAAGLAATAVRMTVRRLRGR